MASSHALRRAAGKGGDVPTGKAPEQLSLVSSQETAPQGSENISSGKLSSLLVEVLSASLKEGKKGTRRAGQVYRSVTAKSRDNKTYWFELPIETESPEKGETFLIEGGEIGEPFGKSSNPIFPIRKPDSIIRHEEAKVSEACDDELSQLVSKMLEKYGTAATLMAVAKKIKEQESQ